MSSLMWPLKPWQARTAIAVLLVIVVGFCWAISGLLGSIPTRKELTAFSSMASANVLYDIADREVFTIAKEHRIEVPLSQMSPDLLKAVVAVEDQRFWEHDGFDPIRIAGAALAVVRAGEAVQGGSTITQQLARQ